MTTKAKGCVKLRRISKLREYYKAGYYRVEANKKRRLATIVRNFPEDLQAQTLLAKLAGEPKLAGALTAIVGSAKKRPGKIKAAQLRRQKMERKHSGQTIISQPSV